MFYRFAPLTPPALLVAVLALLMPAGAAEAHRLNAQAFLLPDKQIQVEAWFSPGGVAKGARVEVLRAGQQPLTSGQLNDEGVFVFAYKEAEALTIIVSASGGHRAELNITATDLTKTPQITEAKGKTSTQKDGNAVVPILIGTHESELPLKDIILGVTFLLALAAFVLSLRNAKRLRDMKS